VNTRNKLRIILGNLFLFAALFGLITLNKDILRPQLNNQGIGQILTGCLPNFLAAFIISLAFVNAILAKKPKNGRRWVYLISFLVFAILTLEEFKPMWGASTHYDSFDVWASGAGSFLAIISYEFVQQIAKGR